MKSVAREVARGGIAVNAVCSDHVDTIMIHNAPSYRLFRPDLKNPSQSDVIGRFHSLTSDCGPLVPPEAVRDTVRYIVTPSSKYITGSTRGVACGNTALMP